MNKQRALTIVLGCALMATGASAQNLPTLYQIALSGTCFTTNASGVVVSLKLSNQSLLREVAQADGTSNFSNWALAYHVGGNELGDTIEIIDRNTGATLRTLFGLYFGEDFGRMALLSGSKHQLKRLEYIYTDQNSHSLGSVLLTDFFFFNSNGTTNRMTVLGQMQWVVVPDSRHGRMQICTANFTTVKAFTFNRR